MQILNLKPDLPAYQFDVFQGKRVSAVVSTRKGGVSPKPWNSLNFSILRGDSPENVRTNLDLFAGACGFGRDDLVMARQVRGNIVKAVGNEHRGQRIEGVDGLMTDVAQLPLLTLYADCVPIVIYDSENHILGVCHAGWQGTTLQIARKLIQSLSRLFGTDPAKCFCGIGPSIGPESYEIGSEVIAEVRRELSEADNLLRPAEKSGHAYLNLWQANLNQVVDAGIPIGQTEVSGMDTAQMTKTFFSHRAERGYCGLFGLLCWLQDD